MTNNKKNKSKLIKKILKIILGFWVFWFLFFWSNGNNTYAQTADWDTITTETTQAQITLDKTLQETKSMLDIILKIIYMLSRPILVIAGNAMDNSLVYWSIFHLDAPLRKFWNIMKNFANYALWFVLLYHILKSLFNWKWNLWSFKDSKTPLWVIKNILIAGILIQASRFLLSAVIDISTIATYAIGWMPLTILKNSDLWDQKILWVNSTMNLSDSKNTAKTIMEDIVIYRTYWENSEYKIAECKIWSWNNWNYTIIGKKIKFISSWSTIWWWILLETWICVLWGIPYRFNEFPKLSSIETNAGYEKEINDIIENKNHWSWFEECWYIIPLFWKSKYNPNCNQPDWIGISTNPLAIEDFGYEWWNIRLNSKTWTTISTLIDKSKWFVWPLITIYSSTLNFGQLIESDWWGDKLTFGIVLKFMIKTFMGIMLILPILALAIIMLARIWILWIVIALTPMIIIDQIFEFKIFDKMEYLKIENIIKLIFAPVLIVFGLSIALIFMSTLSNILKSNQSLQKEDTLKWLWITQSQNKSEWDCYSVLWTWTFCNKLNMGWWLDNISYLLINIFGIAIMWSLLFRTISQTWNIGKKIWETIKKWWEKLAWEMPIVPIGWWVWMNQIIWAWWSEWILNKMTNNITNKMNIESQNELNKALPWRWFKWKDNTIDENKAKNIMQEVQSISSSTIWTDRNDSIREIVQTQTDSRIEWSITDRIKQPENIKLLFEEFKKLNPEPDNKTLTDNFASTLNITLTDIKSIKNYKDEIPTKDINTIIADLNSNKLEALVTILMDQEIELKDKKKYKITKEDNWEYKQQEILPIS